jgi:hypothetical protein
MVSENHPNLLKLEIFSISRNRWQTCNGNKPLNFMNLLKSSKCIRIKFL